MDIKLDSEQLSAALHAAVIYALGEDSKQLIVKQAVAYLTTSTSNNYGRQDSPLLQAINDAARRFAEEFVKDRMASDDVFKTKINEIYLTALEKTFAKADVISERMADALTKALSGTERY